MFSASCIVNCHCENLYGYLMNEISADELDIGSIIYMTDIYASKNKKPDNSE